MTDTMTTNLALTGVRKAATLMVALGAEGSADVLKRLTHEEVERISLEVARLDEVGPEAMQSVLDEFRDRVASDTFAEPAGMDFARKMLEGAMGVEKAKEILDKPEAKPAPKPFEALRAIAPERLVPVLRSEHPQTIALVLSYLPAAAAGTVLSALPQSVQSDVATRVATMEAAPADVARQVEDALLERLNAAGGEDAAPQGGATALVGILDQVDRATERAILEALAASDPALADAVKAQMFAFEDIVKLDNRAVQTVLREVAQEDLRTALKGAPAEISDIIFRNMSERAAETLKEDIEVTGAARARDVEAAQKNIVGVIRKLEHAGEIVIQAADEETAG